MEPKDPQQQPIGHFSLLRSYGVADVLTLANAFAGMASILVMMSFLVSPEPWRVALAIGLLPVALGFDMVDGFVARWRHQHSGFGQELDSLADIVSFGVAPVVIAYGLGMRGGWDALSFLFFVGCGISRLARFNITAAALSDAKGKVQYFEGTPIPSSVLLVLILAICFYLGAIGEKLPLGVVTLASVHWHPLSLLYVANGCAMTSKTLRIPKP